MLTRLLKTGARWYRIAGVWLLSGLVLILVVNAILLLTGRLHRPQIEDLRIVQKYGLPLLQKLYAGWSVADLEQLLRETWTRTYVYEPFTGFKERPFAGRYVNVDDAGIRRTDPAAPWPPDAGAINVFLIGGSTVFGYGLPDNQTLAAMLQRRLAHASERAVRVYNFGRGHYYSTQERILFEQLLLAGQRPTLAIFVDGLNDFYHRRDEPFYAEETRQFMEGRPEYGRFLQAWPLGRWLLARLQAWRDDRPRGAPRAKATPPGTGPTTLDRYDDPALNRIVIDRYLANKRLAEGAAAAFGVPVLFVWQPVPTYRFDLSRHLTMSAKDSPGDCGYCRSGYAYFRERLAQAPAGADFLWCADLQEEAGDEILYVDKIHYSAVLTDRLAAAIAERLLAPDSPVPLFARTAP